jgi:hypothetical protein
MIIASLVVPLAILACGGLVVLCTWCLFPRRKEGRVLTQNPVFGQPNPPTAPTVFPEYTTTDKII